MSRRVRTEDGVTVYEYRGHLRDTLVAPFFTLPVVVFGGLAVWISWRVSPERQRSWGP